jgi:hypothetical protein
MTHDLDVHHESLATLLDVLDELCVRSGHTSRVKELRTLRTKLLGLAETQPAAAPKTEPVI